MNTTFYFGCKNMELLFLGWVIQWRVSMLLASLAMFCLAIKVSRWLGRNLGQSQHLSRVPRTEMASPSLDSTPCAPGGAKLCAHAYLHDLQCLPRSGCVGRGQNKIPGLPPEECQTPGPGCAGSLPLAWKCSLIWGGSRRFMSYNSILAGCGPLPICCQLYHLDQTHSQLC